jgi:hypothetical protein
VLGVRVTGNFSKSIIVDRHFLPRSLPPKVVVSDVDGDRGEPSPELRSSLKTRS